MTYGFNGKGCPDKWVEAHEYDWIYDEANNILYWCTNYQCAEWHKLHHNVIWHSPDFFYDLLREVRTH